MLIHRDVFAVPNRRSEGIDHHVLGNFDAMEPSPNPFSHFASDLVFVVRRVSKTNGVGIDWVATERSRNSENGTGVNASAEKATHRHIRAKAQLYRLSQLVAQLLDLLFFG